MLRGSEGAAPLDGSIHSGEDRCRASSIGGPGRAFRRCPCVRSRGRRLVVAGRRGGPALAARGVSRGDVAEPARRGGRGRRSSRARSRTPVARSPRAGIACRRGEIGRASCRERGGVGGGGGWGWERRGGGCGGS